MKLFENGMSKWTGAIFGILELLLSLPEEQIHTQDIIPFLFELEMNQGERERWCSDKVNGNLCINIQLSL